MPTPTVPNIRRSLNDLLDRIEQDDLPVPNTVHLDGATGQIEVSWMEQDNLDGSRAILRSYGDVFRVHAASRPSEPLLTFHDGHGNEISLWPHPDSMEITVKAR